MFDWVCFIPILNVIVWIFMVSVKNKKSDSYIVGEPELNPVFLNHTCTNSLAPFPQRVSVSSLWTKARVPWKRSNTVKTACSSSNHPDEHDAWFISSLCCCLLFVCVLEMCMRGWVTHRLQTRSTYGYKQSNLNPNLPRGLGKWLNLVTKLLP